MRNARARPSLKTCLSSRCGDLSRTGFLLQSGALQALIDRILEFPPLLGVILLSALPVTELRAGIPYGILIAKQPIWLVVLLATLTTWLVAPLLYLLARYSLALFMRWRWFERVWTHHAEKAQKKMQRWVERWGSLGVALFIGVPLPGFGVYTGTLGAYLLGMSFRRFLWVSLLGTLIMAALVTVATLTGSKAFEWALSHRLH